MKRSISRDRFLLQYNKKVNINFFYNRITYQRNDQWVQLLAARTGRIFIIAPGQCSAAQRPVNVILLSYGRHCFHAIDIN